MKLTDDLVRRFETDQRKHGTKTALSNLLWQKAVNDLKDLGITRVRTEDAKEPREAVQ